MTLATALLWVLWCVGHSLPITPGASAFFRRRMGEEYALFRLGYNLFALTTFIPLAVWTHLRPDPTLVRWTGMWAWGQAAIWAGAGWLFWSGARRYPLGEFLGFQQLKGRGATSGGGEVALKGGGVLEMVRHPWYSATFLVLWGRDLHRAALAANLVLSFYLVLGAHLEERKLEREFGEDYRRYKGEVSMLFPWKWIKNRPRRTGDDG